MSVSGVDYTKRLADKRQEFTDDLESNRAAYRNNLKKLQDTHKYVEEKAHNNYMADKDKLEKGYADKFDQVVDNSKDIIEKKQELYNKKLDHQRGEFVERSEKQLGSFNNRLNDIKTSYADAVDNEKKQNSEISKTHLDRHKEQINSLQNNHKEQVGGLLENALGTNMNLRENMIEKEKIQEKLNARELDDVRKKNSIAKNKQDYSQRKELDKLRDISAKMIDSVEHDKKNSLTTMKKNQENNMNRLFEQYDEANRSAKEVREREKINSGRKLTEALAKQEKINNQERFKERVRSKEVSGAGNRVREKTVGNQVRDLKDRMKFKTDKLLDKIQERELVYTGMANEAKQANDREIQKSKIENMDRMAEQDASQNIYMTDKLEASRRKQDTLVKNYNSRYNDLKEDSEKLFSNERSLSRSKIDLERKNNAKVMKFVSDKNAKALDDLQMNEKKLRTEYFSKLQNEKTDLYHRVRDDFGNKLASEQEVRYKQVGGLTIDNEGLREQLEDTKTIERERADSKMVEQKHMFSEQRKEDFRALKELMRKREHNLRKQLTDQRLLSDRKLYQIGQENHRDVKKLTDFYEGKMDQMIRDFNLKLKRTELKSSRDLDKLRFDWQESQKRMVGQYEHQIDSIRANYEMKLEKVAKREDIA